MLQEVARIERTVQGLVEFAQAPPLDRCMCDLRSLIEAAVDVAQSRAETKSVLLRYLPGSQPLLALVDKDKMLSLLTNLLFNAIDAVPIDGEVRVSIAPALGGVIQVVVSDNGPGIDQAVAGRLFSPFVTTKPSGTGLGLTVAQKVAKEHGGTLIAENRPEGGACFTLTLPATEELHDKALGRR